ncbi:MAG: hypothetical protein ABSF95_12450 [Verrucomicrobiota bacterium]|jgi:hypothetical protein
MPRFDEDLEPAELLGDGPLQPQDLRLLCHIRLEDGGDAAELTDGRRGVVQLFEIAGDQCHAGAGARQRERHGAAEAPSGAGDQRGFAIKFSIAQGMSG